MPASPRVLCLGEALVDRIGPPGLDPATAPVDQLDDRLGGAPANVACALARLGTPVAFLGRLGRDAIGEAFAGLFAERGVSTLALQWDDERPSRIVLVRRDPGGERQFQGFAGDSGAGFADQALEAGPLAGHLGAGGELQAAAWLLLGSIPLASPSAAAALQAALDRATAQGAAVAVDVNWRPTFWNPAADPAAPPDRSQAAAIRRLLGRASLVKCAAEEAEWLFGSRDPRDVQQALPQRPAVVITDGGGPLRWCFGDSSGALPAFPVTVVDTTGAGDAFTAGVLHGLCRRPELLHGQDAEALTGLMRFGSACGALVCEGAGAIDPQPDEAAVASFLTSALASALSPPPG